jgi:hypothetical protein
MKTKLLIVKLVALSFYVIGAQLIVLFLLLPIAGHSFYWPYLLYAGALFFNGLLLDVFAEIGTRIRRVEEEQAELRREVQSLQS